jgi:hypothetical protein
VNLLEWSPYKNSSLNIGSQLYPGNIRLERKWLTVANTLAYYDTATVIAV